MGEAAQAKIEFHPNGLTGEFRSPDGTEGLFVFPSRTAARGAAVTKDELTGHVQREGDTFHFVIQGCPRFELQVERTPSGRLPPPSSLWPNDFVGPAGC